MSWECSIVEKCFRNHLRPIRHMLQLLTINTTYATPPPKSSVVFYISENTPNQCKSLFKYICTLQQKKQQTVKRFTKWKIKSINSFAIHSKSHLNNRVYISEVFTNVLNYHIKPSNSSSLLFTPKRKTSNMYY